METNIRYAEDTGYPTTCPFCSPGRRPCLASSSGLVPDLRRKLRY